MNYDKKVTKLSKNQPKIWNLVSILTVLVILNHSSSIGLVCYVKIAL